MFAHFALLQKELGHQVRVPFEETAFLLEAEGLVKLCDLLKTFGLEMVVYDDVVDGLTVHAHELHF